MYDKMLRRSFRLVCDPDESDIVENLLSAQGFVFEPEPFSPLARCLIHEPFPLGRSLAAFWGLLYIQDRSSMLPPLSLGIRPGDCILDMCASPGSKTGLLAQLTGKTGLVLGNEPTKVRLANLRRNMDTLNLLQVVTSSASGESLPLSDGAWDRILLDPPCSGWGTTDRHPQAVKKWQGDRLKPLLVLQRNLFREAVRLLRPGGMLVYSTCTTNRDENEAQVCFGVRELGLEVMPLPPFPGFSFLAPEHSAECAGCASVSRCHGCEGTLRVDEDASNAQGFYIACLRRPSSSSGGVSFPESLPEQCLSLEEIRSLGFDPGLLPAGEVTCGGDTLRFFPAAARFLPDSLRWQGMVLGQSSRNGSLFIPSPRVRVLFNRHTSALPRLDIDDVRLLEGITQGRSIDTGLSSREAILYTQGIPLGRLRLRSGRAVWGEK